jgi:uncharacterized protein (DUF488 family)
VRAWTIGHGTRPAAELVAVLREADIRTLVDVRRYPGSRRNPQFNRAELAESLLADGIEYLHEPDLGGRRSNAPGEEGFACLRIAAFRSYAAWMGSMAWQAALERALAEPRPCFMCAETLPWRCHRRLIGELLWARGVETVHLVGRGEGLSHRPLEESEAHDGRLYLCGSLVADPANLSE